MESGAAITAYGRWCHMTGGTQASRDQSRAERDVTICKQYIYWDMKDWKSKKALDLESAPVTLNKSRSGSLVVSVIHPCRISVDY